METEEKKKHFDRRTLIESAPLCKACGIPLLTKAESAIGCHVRCVFEQNMKTTKTNIPRPRYGRHGI